MSLAATSSAPRASLTAVLDERADWAAFSRPCRDRGAGQESLESHVAIEGMHCATCSLTVEQALKDVPGVLDATVNAASRMARVVWLPQRTRPSTWFEAVERAGYQALPVGDLERLEARTQASRMALWRWLVAGFCMMQVMMYAWPAYIAQPGDIAPDMAQLLRWASWVMTLPVVLFSCWPFFASAWRDLRRRSLGMDVPVALGILMAFLASSVATFDPSGPWGREVWYDSVTMFVFFLLSGRMLEQRLRGRTAGALETLARRLPDSVERQGPDGGFQRVACHRLRVGDVVRVLPGESFPADGRIIEGSTQVDEALLTGESRALVRSAGAAEQAAVIAGSHNLSGVVLVRVERTGAQTRYAGIVALMQDAALSKPRLARLADRVAQPFLLLVLLASATAAAWWWPSDPSHALGVAVAVLIVTCPCALSLATPAASLAAAGALARRGVLLRDLQALETSTAIDTVVFDKTGTLTRDAMAVTRVHTRAGLEEGEALRWAVALARHSLHPVSRALVRAAEEGFCGVQTGQPVDADTVVEHAGQGLEGLAVQAGSPLGLLRLGAAAFCGVPEDIACGQGSRVHLAGAGGWLASFELDESLRVDATPVVSDLRAQGLEVELLSGDRHAAVVRLGSRAGIDRVFSDRKPEDKLAHVRALQRRGHRVAMVGDGINDAPVLAAADLSFTLGQAASLAQSRADVVILGGQLAAVPALMRHARRTRTVVRQNLAWAAIYNAVCVPLAVMGWMPPWLAGLGMAASSLGVVLNSARLARMPDF
ncbi:MAG: cation-translocating P-type ATPase [Ramlibacter sp.]|nr:cation-translocating P-type ATPase [Ramlibacter sp.]